MSKSRETYEWLSKVFLAPMPPLMKLNEPQKPTEIKQVKLPPIPYEDLPIRYNIENPFTGLKEIVLEDTRLCIESIEINKIQDHNYDVRVSIGYTKEAIQENSRKNREADSQNRHNQGNYKEALRKFRWAEKYNNELIAAFSNRWPEVWAIAKLAVKTNDTESISVFNKKLMEEYVNSMSN